jgi:nitric oxide reductase subunit B
VGIEPVANHSIDPVSNVLKWILLTVAIVTFAVLAWTTGVTYQQAPPFPDRFVADDGSLLMSAEDIQAGKSGFQKADLMDYGSLYGEQMLTELSVERKARIRSAMQAQLQHVDLTQRVAVIPGALAGAITTLQSEIAERLRHDDFARGWTQAYSLDAQSARQTADFLIYSSLTTVARRPGATASWTQNWPYEPSVGNTPTTSTFHWTWISFCFTFFAFGVVIWIYELYLNDPDNAPSVRELSIPWGEVR